MQILIAEDEQDIARLYGEALRRKGHNVVISPNGEDCLQQYISAIKSAAAAAPSSQKKIKDDHIDNSRRSSLVQKTAAMPFDAVVLDYKMPKKDGLAVAKEILALNPHQRIIFASAFVRAVLADSVKQLNGQLVELIQKPFSLAALVETIEDKKIYEELEKIGVDIIKVKETNPTHNQIKDLLEGLRRLQKETAFQSGFRRTMGNEGYSPSDIAKTLDKVLNNLGQPTKIALLHHLSASYGVALADEKTVSIAKIEDALKSMLGDGYSIIMNWLYEEMDNTQLYPKASFTKRLDKTSTGGTRAGNISWAAALAIVSDITLVFATYERVEPEMHGIATITGIGENVTMAKQEFDAPPKFLFVQHATSGDLVQDTPNPACLPNTLSQAENAAEVGALQIQHDLN